MREVVITGIGVLGPHGVGLDRIADAARDGRFVFSAWPESADPPHSGALIGSVGNYPRTRYFSERQLRLMDKPMMFASFAAGAALEDAGYADGTAPPDTATLLGTCRSEQTSIHRFSLPLVQGRPERINPAEFPLVARNIACGQVAIRFGLRGPSSVLASGAMAALEAVARATDLIRGGRAQIALAGGVDVLSKFALHFARKLYGDAALAARPAFFGLGGGLILSEGACMLMLEDGERARARGARIYARVGGWRAGRLGRGDTGAALLDCWKRVLRDDGVAPGQLGLLAAAAGGAGRPHERQEAATLGQWLAGAPASSLLAARSLAGEGEAWTSALQVALAAQALAAGIVLPTQSLAADATEHLARASAGGALQGDGGALVLGHAAGGGFCALHLH